MLASSRHRRAFTALQGNDRWTVIDPIADARWHEFVSRAPDAAPADPGPFHHPAWLALLARSYGYPIRACCLLDDSGAIVAGLPLALVGGALRRPRLAALPFSDHCTPLAADPALCDRLLTALDELRSELGVALELRAPLDTGAQVVDSYWLHEIALEPDADAVIARFRRKSQIMRGVRRAEREGLTVERRTDAAALAEFYGLHVGTRRRQGVPTQPRSFILRFADLFDQGLGFVLLVRDEGQPIAAAVFLSFNGRLIYKYGASDPAALGKRPNNLLFLEAIRWGCANGMRSLDLGRTDIGHDSLRDFKLHWGAEETTLTYHELTDAEHRPSEGPGLAGRAAPLIRRSPPLVSRLIGEALYRYAG
jgi:CelD/BcsL family acetyltransferase involved in cellulose biosynthesis